MVARRTSPSGPFVTADRLRYRGLTAPTSVAAVSYLMGTGEADFIAITGAIADLGDGANLVESEAYPLGRVTIERLLDGVPTGDADIVYTVVQSTDDGATWVSVSGAASITFQVDETGTKTISLGVVVPRGALLGVQADYPANYVQPATAEIVLAVVEVQG